jgi:predicted regulator of Ras-like GTPase activity (Roadblock/LC7/MglB family)
MPGMNGLDLLIEVNNRYPDTGVIIMTAYPSNAYEREAMMSGSLRFVEKPFDINDMRDIVKGVLKTNDGFQGTVDGIDLMDIVQFNGLSQATSALKVTTADQEGMIFFKKGEVVHAMCDQASGEEAFFKVLRLQGGTLQNIRGVEPPIMSIKKSLESLLFEAARRNDEDLDSQATNEPAGTQAPMATLEDLDTGDLIAPFEDEAQADAGIEDTVSSQEDASPAGEPDEIADIDPNDDLIEDPLLEDEEQSDQLADQSPLETEQEADDIGRDLTEKQEVNSDIQTTITEDTEMTDIQKILAEFTNIEGVHTACLVGRDGFLLDNIARSGIDAEMIGAIASSGFGSAESMGTQLGQGELNMTMLEYAEGPVMFAPVGVEAFLVIVADKETNLGWIRLTIKKNSKVIEKAAAL